MSAQFGPYVQMGKIAQQMAVQYQKDTKLALDPLVAHFMDEVEVNVTSDKFDHLGFMEKIRGSLASAAEIATAPRRLEFLQAVVHALDERIQQTQACFENTTLVVARVPSI
jgi:hypothetical protein